MTDLSNITAKDLADGAKVDAKDEAARTLAASRRTATIAFQPELTFNPDKKASFKVQLGNVPESVLGDILIAGARVILTNAYNSGGKDTPEADRLSNVERRVAAWNRGEYALTNTGPRDSVIGDMRDAFIAKQVALGKTAKQAEESIRATVTQAFGEKEKATFSRFLDAVATIKAKADSSVSYDDFRAKLEKQANDAADKLRAEREASKAAVEVNADELF